MTADLLPFERPAPTDKEIADLIRLTGRIIQCNQGAVIEFISALLLENLSLTKEVNTHRAALGFEPLPTYAPKPK